MLATCTELITQNTVSTLPAPSAYPPSAHTVEIISDPRTRRDNRPDHHNMPALSKRHHLRPAICRAGCAVWCHTPAPLIKLLESECAHVVAAAGISTTSGTPQSRAKSARRCAHSSPDPTRRGCAPVRLTTSPGGQFTSGPEHASTPHRSQRTSRRTSPLAPCAYLSTPTVFRSEARGPRPSLGGIHVSSSSGARFGSTSAPTHSEGCHRVPAGWSDVRLRQSARCRTLIRPAKSTSAHRRDSCVSHDSVTT